VATLASAFVGCDDGGGQSYADIAGNWDLSTTPTGAPTTTVTALLEQNRGVATGTCGIDTITFTISGQSVSGVVYTEAGGVFERTTFTGTVSAVSVPDDHMEGEYTYESGPVGGDATTTVTGTWTADLTTRALYDVTGTWYIDYTWGGSTYSNTADLTMAPDGTVTGTFHHYFGDMDVTGSVHGYDVSLVMDDG
jgi:hypothetical protein